MIKLDIKPNCGKYSNNHLRCLLRLEPELEKLGISFSTGNGDVQLIQLQEDVEGVNRLLDRGAPTIIQDLYLGPELFWWAIREYIPRDNVKVVLKTSKFVDASLYDIRFREDMKHVSIIADDHKHTRYATSVSEFYDKITVFANIVAWDYFHPPFLEYPKFDLNRHKAYDVSIVLGEIGRVYPVKETREHRYTALDAVYRLKDKYRVFVKMPTDAEIPRRDYNKILADSKVCLSPWGFDITCWRDYEAALCGAVVIKPDTSFGISWPEIPYVACKADFSDFPEVLDHILANFGDFDEQRMRAYSNAMKGKDNTILAKRLARIIKSCLE